MKKNSLGVLFGVFILCSVLLLNAAGTSLYLLNEIVPTNFSELEISTSKSNNDASQWFASKHCSAPCYLSEIEENEVEDSDNYSSNLIIIPRELKDPSCLSKYYSTLSKGPFSKSSKIYLLYHSFKLDC